MPRKDLMTSRERFVAALTLSTEHEGAFSLFQVSCRSQGVVHEFIGETGGIEALEKSRIARNKRLVHGIYYQPGRGRAGQG